MKYLFLFITALFILQGCSDDGTSTAKKECRSDSECKEWQLCNDSSKCELKEGMCEKDADCTDETKTKCSSEHTCVEPVEVEDCTTDGNECANNTNGKTVCVDDKCAEPVEVEDCTEDGNECANNTNGKTVCGSDKKCQLPPNAEDCTADGNECADNTNGKTVCVDDKCAEPVEVEDCTVDGNECADNTNGKTVCVDDKCAEPVEVEDCTADGNECANNTNGKTICVNDKCAEPVEVKDCSADGNECADNTNGATECKDNQCVVPGCEATEEICDGLDNDCDGAVDEDLTAPKAEKQFGVCENSLKVCDGANGWIEPDYTQIANYESEESLCDDIDNDCDNAVDEGCGGCTDGDKKECGTDVGSCEKGQQTCENGVWGDCIGGVTPTEEVCDGKDNDCNGDIDDNLVPENAEKQDGVCAGSKKVCALDTEDNTVKWLEPDYSLIDNYEETETLCDDLDNDCNGETDEGLKHTYYKDSDGDNFGVASDTIEACSVPEGYVENNNDCKDNDININPDAEEVCDGIDNNCDGQADEGFLNTDGDTLPDCMDTDDDNDGFPDNEDCAPLNKFINPNAQEVCDGVDNDCDELIDADDDSLEDAPLADNQNGICNGSKKVCNNEWVNPDYTALNDYEADDASCDGVDNNCSGENDEGYVVTDTSCGVGECSETGNLECQNGQEVDTCIPGEPADEICDGKDNDCDAEIDEELAPPLADMQDGVCTGSKKVCNGSDGWGEPDYTEIDTYEAREVTCDDLDNDCDGSVDENPIELCTASDDDSIKACIKDIDTEESSCKQILSGVEYLSLGSQSSCAFNANNNGMALCWGDNSYGELGDGSNTTSYIPVTLDDSFDASVVINTDSGRMSNCSVIADGTIRCWGMNNFGQLGNNSTDDSNIPVVVEDYWGDVLENMDTVSAGGYHACGVYKDIDNEDNFVYCWGHNDKGQLGNNSINDKNYAVKVKNGSSYNSNLTDVQKVVVGIAHSCALMEDDTVYCWGDNSKGQLGDNSAEDYSKIAKKVDGIDNVIDIVAGDNFTCVNYITDDGSAFDIKCWGDNSYKQIKDSLLSKYDEPVSLAMSNVDDFTAKGGYICYILENDGGVLCRGENNNYQIGSTSPSVLSDTKGYEIVSGATGKQHLCVIVNSSAVNYRAVMCRGLNDSGQLGVGYTSENPDYDAAYVKEFNFVLAPEE